MESFDEELTQQIDRYIEALFVSLDCGMTQSLDEAATHGLAPIHVSANQGKLLYILARMTGARRILEIGTLGAYSTSWLARTLPHYGKVVTLEINPTHAKVARQNIDRCGFGDLVEIRVGRATELLCGMIESGEEPFDLIFIDADKPSYVEYLHLVISLARPGTVILADNVLRIGLVLEDIPTDESARAAKAYNLAIAQHPRLESIVLPIFRDKLDGLAISIVQ